MQWWFKKFCKGDERLEDEENSGQLLEVLATKIGHKKGLNDIQIEKEELKLSLCADDRILYMKM